MLSSSTSAAQDLQSYQNGLKFPPNLQREFRRDFSERQPPMLRQFFAWFSRTNMGACPAA